MKQFGALIAMTLAATLLLFAGCSGGKNSPATGGQQMTSASLTITWPARGRLIPLAAESIRISVAGPNYFGVTQVMNRPAAGGTSTTNFPSLPVGQLTFTAKAYPLANGSGRAQAAATMVLTGEANVPLEVNLTMASTITFINITPTYSYMNIEPFSPRIPKNYPLHLDCYALDAQGMTVLVPVTDAYIWSSSDESIATVDSNGLVTPHAEGTVTITATERESGISGTKQVTVTAPVTFYSIQDIGNGRALDINDAGQIVGNSYYNTSSNRRASIWAPDGSMQDLGATLGSGNSSANGINNAGQVVGSFTLPDGSTHAYLWTPGSGVQDLGLLPGAYYSLAKDINDAGQVVGSCNFPDGTQSAFLWTPEKGMQNLGILPGCNSSAALRINEDGQVVGESFSVDETHLFAEHAILWTPGGGMEDLGAISGSTGSVAMAINDHEQVVGYCDLANGDRHAFLWTRAGGMQDYGASYGMSIAADINNAGQIAGRVYETGKAEKPVLFTPGCDLQYLKYLGGSYARSSPTRINNVGQMVGVASSNFNPPDLSERAIQWIPQQYPD